MTRLETYSSRVFDQKTEVAFNQLPTDTLKKHMLTDPIVFPESCSTNQPYL